MEPERKKPGGFPPKTEQKPYSVHAAIRKGIAVFFCSTGFFLFPGPYPSSGKSRQPSACTFGVRVFSLSGNASFCYFPTGQVFHVAGATVRLDFFPKFRRNGGTQRGRWKKRIWVRGQFVEVTYEVYDAYIRGDRKMRYFEDDLKRERPVYGSNGEIRQVLPSGRIPWTG